MRMDFLCSILISVRGWLVMILFLEVVVLRVKMWHFILTFMRMWMIVCMVLAMGVCVTRFIMEMVHTTTLMRMLHGSIFRVMSVIFTHVFMVVIITAILVEVPIRHHTSRIINVSM